MNDLRQTQRYFQSHVLSQDERISREIISTPSASAQTRLRIYRNAYRLRLLEALGTDYPALNRLLGATAFENACRAYIDEHPSREPNLRWFGGKLDEFLRTNSPYCDRRVLSEMAEFEWALTLAFDAADESVVTVAELGAIPGQAWPGLTFRLHPSVRRLALQHNVAAYWKQVDAQQEPTELPRESERPVDWVIWRRELRSYFRSLDADEAFALDCLKAGENFAEICAALSDRVAEAELARYAATLLKRWVTDGLISRFLAANEANSR
jgi:hypothetical protein